MIAKQKVEKHAARERINTVFLMAGLCALAILACLFAYRFDNKYTAPGPRASEGLLRLDEETLELYPVLLLTDGWAFYNGLLLSPSDRETPPPEYIHLGKYGGFDAQDATASPHGSATYKLRIEIPEEPRVYMLELPEIFSAYRLYINGREAAVMGEPDPENYRPAVGNRTVSFEAGSAVEIIFAVSDFTHFYSGMIFPPAFGDPQAVSALLQTRFLFRAVLCSIVLTIGFLSLLIGALSQKKPPGLLFALLCLCYAGYAAYPLLRTFISSYYPWYALENLSYNAALALVLLLQTMVCGIKDRWSRGLLWFGLFACLAAIAVHIALPAGNLRLLYAYSDFMTAYEWITAVYITVTAARAIRRDAVNSQPLLCGALIFDIALIMDRMLPLHEPVVTGWFPELAGFVLVLTIGIAIAKELAGGYKEAAVLRERGEALERLSEMQQNYYRVLKDKATEVESSRHDLRHHYAIIGGLVRDRRYEEIEAYLTESMGSMDTAGPKIYCANNIINVLANHYDHIADQNNIHFDLRCDLQGETGLPDAEMCAILGNLLENAVEACLRMETGRRFIRVSITAVGRLLTFRVWNSTEGQLKPVGGSFLSSKNESGFGYGLESLRIASGRRGGEVRFIWDKKERVFDSTVILFL